MHIPCSKTFCQPSGHDIKKGDIYHWAGTTKVWSNDNLSVELSLNVGYCLTQLICFNDEIDMYYTGKRFANCKFWNLWVKFSWTS